MAGTVIVKGVAAAGAIPKHAQNSSTNDANEILIQDKSHDLLFRSVESASQSDFVTFPSMNFSPDHKHDSVFTNHGPPPWKQHLHPRVFDGPLSNQSIQQNLICVCLLISLICRAH
ncbi:hypothetical protein [Loktanella sp. M215]|uniref:hypothetical protein n=1 Tax=Loktanella sp. M215 TaxID=2675431 RepID=UPI001F38FD1C|nr:hypothetical protein [Loktanella sp. M215]